MEKKNIIKLTETAIMLAMSTVLSLIAIVKMPFGGDITACSMLPMIILAYRYGFGYGLITCSLYGAIQLLLGLNNLSYCATWIAVIAVILLDYILAFGCCSLSGLFKNRKSQVNALIFGSLSACAGRFILHTIAGSTVWAGLSIPTKDAFIGSILYNSAYMIPETIITVSAALYLGQVIDFSKPMPTRTKKLSSSFGIVNALGLLALIITVVVDVLIVFMTIQTEDGFIFENIKSCNFLLLTCILFTGIIIFIVTNIINKKHSQKIEN